VEVSVVFAANASLRYNHMAMVEWLPRSSSSSEDDIGEGGRLVVAWQAARSSEGSASQVNSATGSSLGRGCLKLLLFSSSHSS